MLPSDDQLFMYPVFQVTVDSEHEPVSINDAYRVYRGTLYLTKEGKAYKDKLADEIARSTTKWKVAQDVVYQYGGRAMLVVTLYFTDLLNAAWTPGGMTKGGKKAKPRLQNPYKRKDTSNYIKLLEDAVSRGVGIDDCNTLDIDIKKRHDPDRSHVHILMTFFVNEQAHLDELALTYGGL